MLKMVELLFELDALEPIISAPAMNLHYNTHYKGYIDKANEFVAKFRLGDFASAEEILDNVMFDLDHKRFDDGGFYEGQIRQAMNHELFWETLSPEQQVPSEKLAQLIANNWGTFEKFVDTAVDLATHRVGSGWLSFVITGDEESEGLDLILTADQYVHFPNLGVIDLFEHAYYLDWDADRGKFVKELMYNGINWKAIEDKIESE